MKRILGLSVFSLLSLIINVFASAPDNLLSKKLSVSFNVPANNAIGIHEFFLIDAVNSTNYYFKTSNDSSDSPFWLFELYHYRKTTSTDATVRIISSDGGWVDIVLSFTSSNFASATISGYGTNGEVEWTGTADVSVLDLQISEIPSANQPNILTTDLSPTSISGGTLSAQDSYWPVYNESISFTSPGTLSVNITNGDDNPTGSGSYSYSTTGTNSASLSYTIDGAGITFEYALQFTGENAGIYTKYADYGGGTTDVTTGPFSLSGVAVPEQFNWEEYDDFSTGSLNASKWGTMNFYGGDKPEVKDGRVVFSSSGKSVSATSDFKQGWNSTEFINYTEGAPGSVLYVNDSTVYGMEASITLPVGSSPKTAICLQVGSLNPFGQHIAELMNDSGNGAGFWIHDYVADTGVSISASSATTFQVAVIHENEKNTFYINSKKVHELDASNFTPDWFGINTFENDGKAYAVYADNVRVLRRSSFSSLIKIAPLAISAFRDQVYLQGQNELVKLDGASEINFDLQLVGKPAVTAATITVDGVTYDLTNLQAPPQFLTTYGYSIYDDELYDVESSSDSDWSSYVNGKNFSFSFTSEGDSYSYSHDLPPVSALPPIPNTTLAGSPTWNVGSDGNEYQEVEVGSSLTLNWPTFSSANINDFITVSVEELVGDKEIEVMSSTSLSSSTTSYEFPSSLFVSEKKYVLYVAFHKVTQSENPTGFDHQVGTDKTQALLVTTARSVTAVDVNIIAKTPTTVVSDPNGQAVVVQVGEEYKWSSTLDGVTLWGVEQSSDGWSSMTMRFENGRNFGNEGFYDSVAQPQPYDVSYEIDENGFIKSLEDDGDYQYYNAVSVENGLIGTIQNDEGVDSVANNGINQVDQWFFTTRAAAEEYYYSKVNPKDWMWFDNYPWVYSSELQEWLYFYPSGSKLLYYSNKSKAWREFN